MEADLFNRRGNNSNFFLCMEVIAAEVPLEPERLLIYLIQLSADHVTSTVCEAFRRSTVDTGFSNWSD